MQQTSDKLTKRTRIEDEITFVGERRPSKKSKSIPLNSAEFEIEGTYNSTMTSSHALRVRFSLWTS